jgi:hypothetical protein
MEEEAGTIIEKEESTGKEEIFTKIVRAGKRTYFFDVKATRKDDYYLTITESKKRLGKEGKVFYEKLKDAVGYIGNGKEITHTISARTPEEKPVTVAQEIGTGEFTNIDFDDLGKE